MDQWPPCLVTGIAAIVLAVLGVWLIGRFALRSAR
jgi:hypothetical protein